jgi:hypothetical protein
VLDGGDGAAGEQHRRCPGEGHVGEELAAGQVEVPEHDEVREVGTGQEQAAGIGEE